MNSPSLAPPGGPNRVPHPDLAGVIDRNIQALVSKRRESDRKRTLADRLADSITRFAGSMRFAVLHLVLFGLWIVINLRWIPGLPVFDPTFVVLAMFASVEAIFLSTFVLISQNRMAAMADRRADLDLQISLLAEHEITKLLALVRAIGLQLGVKESQDPELNELARTVPPEKVLDKLERGNEEAER